MDVNCIKLVVGASYDALPTPQNLRASYDVLPTPQNLNQWAEEAAGCVQVLAH